MLQKCKLTFAVVCDQLGHQQVHIACSITLQHKWHNFAVYIIKQQT